MKKVLINYLHFVKENILNWGKILFAILLASVGLKAFLLPNGFLDGGVTGLAILVKVLFGFNVSVTLVLISIPFLILAWFTLSKSIVYKSFISILLLAFVISLEDFPPITNDKLLISIFGGLFLGAGIGIAIRSGTVLDGSEVLGVYVNNRFGIPIGTVILVFNIILFAVTGLVISIEVAMYSILTYLVTAKVIDYLIRGFEDFIGLMIVSQQPDKLQDAIINEIQSGLTITPTIKGYGKTGTQQTGEMIHLVINRIDMRRALNVINEVDANAFIIEFDVIDVKGGVLRKYLTFNKKSTH